MDWLEYENKNIARGFLNICGVDEAGRGPLAGPVCAAAVILPENTVIEGVNDSKRNRPWHTALHLQALKKLRK